jgi:hypothetical protein
MQGDVLNLKHECFQKVLKRLLERATIIHEAVREISSTGDKLRLAKE